GKTIPPVMAPHISAFLVVAAVTSLVLSPFATLTAQSNAVAPLPPQSSRTLDGGTVFGSYEDAAVFLNGLIGAEADSYGALKIDLGSASAGRYSFRLADVLLSMEERPRERGCAD